MKIASKLLSVVTVCLNDNDLLIKTIKSIRTQSFDDFEYIIIDGGSSDATIQTINKNLDIVDLWISEKDNGIYDAFNKGINLSKGKYIHLLNAGDIYFSKLSLSLLNFQSDYNFLCNSVLKKSSNDWVWLPRLNEKSNFVDVSHPGLIVKKSFYNKNKYSTKYSFVSDNLFISKHVNPKDTLISDQILVIMSDGGVSTKLSLKHELEKHKLLFYENYRQNEKLTLHFKYIFFFFINFFKKILKV
tara:strand:+ start:693 stop:1424 length:732 start_codon:yes stop_codon:yes gene_type:complete